MPHDDHSSDNSSDIKVQRNVYSNAEIDNNTQISNSETRLNEHNVQSAKSPPRPKCGSTFSIKYLLGLDTKPSSSASSSEQLADESKPIHEFPTDSTQNCA